MRRARIGFWSALVAIVAYGGAVTSSIASWTETFRIEDLADDVSAADQDLFEHFRPDTAAFLNGFGWFLCAVVVVAAAVSVGLWGTRLHWSVSVLVGLAAGAVASLCTMLAVLQVPVVAGFVGLGAVAYHHAKGLVPAGGAEPAQNLAQQDGVVPQP